jgi:hypothetical protein
VHGADRRQIVPGDDRRRTIGEIEQPQRRLDVGLCVVAADFEKTVIPDNIVRGEPEPVAFDSLGCGRKAGLVESIPIRLWPCPTRWSTSCLTAAVDHDPDLHA